MYRNLAKLCLLSLAAVLLSGCEKRCYPNCSGDSECCAIDESGDGRISSNKDTFVCKPDYDSCAASASGKELRWGYSNSLPDGKCNSASNCKKSTLFALSGEFALNDDASKAFLSALRSRYAEQLQKYKRETAFKGSDPEFCFTACGGSGDVNPRLCPKQTVSNGITLGLLSVYSKLDRAASKGQEIYPIEDVYTEYGIDPDSDDCNRSDVVIDGSTIINTGLRCPSDFSESIGLGNTLSGRIIAPTLVQGEFSDAGIGVLFPSQQNAFELEFNDPENQKLLGGHIEHTVDVRGSVGATVQSPSGPYCQRIVGDSTEADVFASTILPIFSDSSAHESIASFLADAVEFDQDTNSDEQVEGELVAFDSLTSEFENYFPLTSGSDGDDIDVADLLDEHPEIRRRFPNVTGAHLLMVSDYSYCALRFDLAEVPNPLATLKNPIAGSVEAIERERVAGEFLRCVVIGSSIDADILTLLSRFD